MDSVNGQSRRDVNFALDLELPAGFAECLHVPRYRAVHVLHQRTARIRLSRAEVKPRHRSARFLVFPVVALLAAAGCTRGAAVPREGLGSPTGHGPVGSVPVVTPSTAYGPFPYHDPSQRRTFQAFIDCAADHGVTLQGPLADSAGNGVYFRLASGAKPSHAATEKVNRDCPQMTVGTFGTPIGAFHAKLFKHAANQFARCIRSHGFPQYPVPDFSGGDLVHAFWRLSFDWASVRFVSAVKACVEPLRSYLFSS